MNNKIDILLDVVEFNPPYYDYDKATITLEFLNSKIKKFQISLKQYNNLKESILNQQKNVYICFSQYGYIWSNQDNLDFLLSSFNAECVFSEEQFNSINKVKLSCNEIQKVKYTSNNIKDYDLSIIATNDDIKNELIRLSCLNYDLIDFDFKINFDIDKIKLVQKNTSPDYQNLVSKLSYLNHKYGMFMEPGLGKTKTVIDSISTLLKNKEISKCIVIPPANLIKNWNEELEKHCNKTLISKFLIISNKNLEKLEQNKKKILALQINIDKETDKNLLKELKTELISLLPITEQYKDGILSGNIAIVIDESHNFKNPLAIKTKYLLSVISKKSKIFLLSGTPFPKGFQDMFVTMKIFNILSEKINYFQFKNFFFDEVKNGFGGVEKLIIKKDKEYLSKLLISRLRGRSSFVKKDILNLPEQKYNIHYYEPSAEQEAVIQNILNNTPIPDFVKEDNKIPFSNKELKDSLIRIMQVQGGFYLDKDKNFCEMEENNKFKALCELVEQHKTEKLIIFCAFTAEADLINKKLNELGYKSVCKHGKLKKKVADEAISNFRSSEYSILVATGDSAGTGITLIESFRIIYYSNNFNAVTREQADGRIHRFGQTNECHYHDLLSKGGVDEIIYNCIKRKRISKNEMFSKLKQLIK